MPNQCPTNACRAKPPPPCAALLACPGGRIRRRVGHPRKPLGAEGAFVALACRPRPPLPCTGRLAAIHLPRLTSPRPQRRQFPSRIVIYLGVAASGIAIFYASGGLLDYEHTSGDNHRRFCLFQVKKYNGWNLRSAGGERHLRQRQSRGQAPLPPSVTSSLSFSFVPGPPQYLLACRAGRGPAVLARLHAAPPALLPGSPVLPIRQTHQRAQVPPPSCCCSASNAE